MVGNASDSEGDEGPLPSDSQEVSPPGFVHAIEEDGHRTADTPSRQEDAEQVFPYCGPLT